MRRLTVTLDPGCERSSQLLYIAHVLACLWFLITWVGDHEEITWLDVYDGYASLKLLQSPR